MEEIEIVLSKSYGTFQLDVQLSLPGRGVSVLFGASGCGKTRLLRCFSGLDRAKGKVVVAGRIWQDDNLFLPVHKRPLAYVFQHAALFPHLDVKANLYYGIKRNKTQHNPEQWDFVLSLLGIESLLKRQVDNLSGGERQRVAIAQALLLNPEVLLMDEPLAALDKARKKEIMPYLESLHQKLAIPIIYVTHSSDEVARLADYLVIMEHGKVIAKGELDEVLLKRDIPLQLDEDEYVVLKAEVAALFPQWSMMQVRFNGGLLWLSDNNCRVGDKVRVRIHARDVSLSLKGQDISSILNKLPASIEAIYDCEHPAIKLVKLSISGSPVLCRLTARSCEFLDLHPGKKLWAQIKSVALVE